MEQKKTQYNLKVGMICTFNHETNSRSGELVKLISFNGTYWKIEFLKDRKFGDGWLPDRFTPLLDTENDISQSKITLSDMLEGIDLRSLGKGK